MVHLSTTHEHLPTTHELLHLVYNRYCQSMMDLWWRGGAPSSACDLGRESVMLITVHALVPLVNPHVLGACFKKASSFVHHEPSSESTLLFQAFFLSSRTDLLMCCTYVLYLTLLHLLYML